MDILDHIEWEMKHLERMRVHEERMYRVRLALAYAQATEGIPFRMFGEVQFIHLN
tara:strand:+ start:481 stop:645 length:165 start_codon:yes stop_codon:yes gene_type:complete